MSSKLGLNFQLLEDIKHNGNESHLAMGTKKGTEAYMSSLD
jgi:hypothetical protein